MRRKEIVPMDNSDLANAMQTGWATEKFRGLNPSLSVKSATDGPYGDPPARFKHKSASGNLLSRIWHRVTSPITGAVSWVSAHTGHSDPGTYFGQLYLITPRVPNGVLLNGYASFESAIRKSAARHQRLYIAGDLPAVLPKTYMVFEPHDVGTMGLLYFFH